MAQIDPQRSSPDSARRLRVLTLISTLDPLGGAETLAVEIATRLDPGRFDRWLCATRWHQDTRLEASGGGAIRRLESADVRFVGLTRRSRRNLLAMRPLIELLRKERIDIIHAHVFGSNVWASLLGSALRVPVVIAHEHMWSYENAGPSRRFLDRELIARNADAFIAVSREGRRQMIEIERIDPADVTYIPNGIATLPVGDGGPVREALGIPAGAPVVGTVGLLRPEKAYEVLIESAALLASRRPDLRVLIAGDGDERPRLERLIEGLGLTERVHLLGFRTDIPDLLAAFDVAVCCSDFEGGSLSIMEYMDAALPIVATRVGGTPELIEDGVHGVLVSPRDPDALEDGIVSLLDAPDRAREMGLRARERRRSEHGIDGFIDRIERLYERLWIEAGGLARG